VIVQASYASPPLAAQQVSYSFTMDLTDDETDDPDQYIGLYGSLFEEVKYKIVPNLAPQFKNDTQFFYTFQ